MCGRFLGIQRVKGFRSSKQTCILCLQYVFSGFPVLFCRNVQSKA